MFSSQHVIVVYLELSVRVYGTIVAELALDERPVQLLELFLVVVDYQLLVLSVQQLQPLALVVRYLDDALIQRSLLGSARSHKGRKSQSTPQVLVLVDVPDLFRLGCAQIDVLDRALHHRADQQRFPVLQVSFEVVETDHAIPKVNVLLLLRKLVILL